MEFFDAFMKETLRMYSPNPGSFPRRAMEDHTIGDIKIRKGDLVVANAFYNWFNTKYFDEPTKFYPERWINCKEFENPYVFAPFWAGPRNCVAIQMISVELKTMLGEFLRNFNFKLDPNYKLVMMFGANYGP